MATPIDIVNSALGELGDTTIAAFDEGTPLADLATVHYPTARDAVLALHPWNFAMVRSELARAAEAPAFGFANQFPLPTDPYCLTVWFIDDEDAEWEVGYDHLKGTRVLLTDLSAVKIGYTARVENTEIWDPVAVKALIFLLAADFALPRTGQSEKRAQMQAAFADALNLAQRRDSKEGRRLVRPQTVLTTDVR